MDIGYPVIIIAVLQWDINYMGLDWTGLDGSGLVNLYNMNFPNILLPESIGIRGMRGMLTNTEHAQCSCKLQSDAH